VTVDTYLDLALLPDVEGLAELVLGRVATQGALPVYERLLQPALEEVGRRWENDELTVADEHLVTALTEQVLTRVGRRVTSGPMAVVACTPGNEHRVGAVTVSDTLGLAGWNPALLGARTPFEDLAALCSARDVRLVALSVGIEEELGVLGPQLERLRLRVGPDVHVIVGGGAVRRQEDWHAPADVTVCTSVSELLGLARELLPVPAVPV
jgi:MerR family transcriptional regulator, light-induced transcriptional regulator